MPNYVYNYLTIHAKGDTLKKIKKDIITIHREKIYDGCTSIYHNIDFNKIIPMPKELEDTDSPPTIVSEKEYKKIQSNLEEYKKNNPHSGIPITRRIQKEYKKKFGFDNWYDWRKHHWNTKWNSSCGKVKGNVLHFLTAWTPPTPILVKLSEMYPKVKFTLKFFNEDLGYDVREISYIGGKVDEQHFPEDHKESFDFIFDLEPERKEDYRLINGEYIHIDELPNSVDFIIDD